MALPAYKETVSENLIVGHHLFENTADMLADTVLPNQVLALSQGADDSDVRRAAFKDSGDWYGLATEMWLAASGVPNIGGVNTSGLPDNLNDALGELNSRIAVSGSVWGYDSGDSLVSLIPHDVSVLVGEAHTSLPSVSDYRMLINGFTSLEAPGKYPLGLFTSDGYDAIDAQTDAGGTAQMVLTSDISSNPAYWQFTAGDASAKYGLDNVGSSIVLFDETDILSNEDWTATLQTKATSVGWFLNHGGGGFASLAAQSADGSYLSVGRSGGGNYVMISGEGESIFNGTLLTVQHDLNVDGGSLYVGPAYTGTAFAGVYDTHFEVLDTTSDSLTGRLEPGRMDVYNTTQGSTASMISTNDTATAQCHSDAGYIYHSSVGSTGYLYSYWGDNAGSNFLLSVQTDYAPEVYFDSTIADIEFKRNGTTRLIVTTAGVEVAGSLDVSALDSIALDLELQRSGTTELTIGSGLVTVENDLDVTSDLEVTGVITASTAETHRLGKLRWATNGVFPSADRALNLGIAATNRFDNGYIKTLYCDGVVCPSLATSAGGTGTERLYVDTSDSNRVKWG